MMALIAPDTMIPPATRADKDRNTRPLYLATMLIALVAAGWCNMLIPSQLDIVRATDERERQGFQFFWDYGPVFVILWLGVAFGCLLAVILHRRPTP